MRPSVYWMLVRSVDQRSFPVPRDVAFSTSSMTDNRARPKLRAPMAQRSFLLVRCAECHLTSLSRWKDILTPVVDMIPYDRTIGSTIVR